jgi:hypothetical protein
MRLNVDKLLSEGWYFFYLGKTRVLAAPKGSHLQRQAARLETAHYKGEVIRYFKYCNFPWDDYKG